MVATNNILNYTEYRFDNCKVCFRDLVSFIILDVDKFSIYYHVRTDQGINRDTVELIALGYRLAVHMWRTRVV